VNHVQDLVFYNSGVKCRDCGFSIAAGATKGDAIVHARETAHRVVLFETTATEHSWNESAGHDSA